MFGCEEYKCLGPYNSSFCEKTPGGGAAHHPGKLMHKLRGENLAYFYLTILEDALDSLKSLMCTSAQKYDVGSDNSGDNNNRIEVKRSDNGDTNTGNTLKRRRLQLNNHDSLAHSGKDDATAAYISKILNLTISADRGEKYQNTKFMKSNAPAPAFIPTANDVYKHVLLYLRFVQEKPLPDVPTSYNITEISNTPQCYTNYEPRMSNALQDIVIPQYSNWQLNLSFLDKAAVEKSMAKGYGYIDRKYIFSSTGLNTTLTIQIHNKVEARVWLCEVQKGFAKYPSNTILDLAEGADVYIRYNYIHRTQSQEQNQASKNLSANHTTSAYVAPDFTTMAKTGKKSNRKHPSNNERDGVVLNGIHFNT